MVEATSKAKTLKKTKKVKQTALALNNVKPSAISLKQKFPYVFKSE